MQQYSIIRECIQCISFKLIVAGFGVVQYWSSALLWTMNGKCFVSRIEMYYNNNNKWMKMFEALCIKYNHEAPIHSFIHLNSLWFSTLNAQHLEIWMKMFNVHVILACWWMDSLSWFLDSETDIPVALCIYCIYAWRMHQQPMNGAIERKMDTFKSKAIVFILFIFVLFLIMHFWVDTSHHNIVVYLDHEKMPTTKPMRLSSKYRMRLSSQCHGYSERGWKQVWFDFDWDPNPVFLLLFFFYLDFIFLSFVLFEFYLVSFNSFIESMTIYIFYIGLSRWANDWIFI